MATLVFGNTPINMTDSDALGLGGFFSDDDLVIDSLSANTIVLRDPGTDTLVTLDGAFNLNSQTSLEQSIFVNLQIEDDDDNSLLELEGVSATVGSLLDSDNVATYFQNLLAGGDSISGGDQDDILRGYNGDDTISGGAGIDNLGGGSGNDTLDGGLGNDTLTGGAGNDIYLNVVAGDTVTEQSGQGIDAILAAASLVLPANVEHLALQGSGDFSGTGNGLNNVISGNDGNNTLQGLGGNDTLDGGAGVNTLQGGTGNDTYVVRGASDIVDEETNEGVDQAISLAAAYTLTDNVEKLTLSGTDDINGTGNTLANTIEGNAGNNIISGGDGNDTIGGGDGNDALAGDAGNDKLTGAAGNDTLDGGTGVDNMNGGNGDDTFVVDVAGDVVTEAANAGTDTVRASSTYTLGTNLENLELTGINDINGTGNSSVNVITGNDGDNTLDGKGGADTMNGGLGDDTFIVNNVGDTVVEDPDEGDEDTVTSSVTYTLGANVENLTLTGSAGINGTGNASDNTIVGNSANNSLVGLAGNDTLNGGAGIDNMTGGVGDDIYVINTLSDVTNEDPGLVGGNDTIQSSVTLSLDVAARANVENATLIGSSAINVTGNGGDNVLNGNTAANTLNGGGGADTMNGNKGNDTYVVDNVGDTVTEDFASSQGGGTDLVQSSVDFTLGANVEKLTLTGAGDSDGTGNTLNNTLIGNSGNNTLDGLSGTDNMNGGAGNDTYVVDVAGDVVTESSASGGTDTVQSSITYTLGANLENLTLLLNGPINGTGNGLANTIVGNIGNNTLDGRNGNDTVTGGGSVDIFRFSTAPNTASNVDVLTDFTAATDIIELENSVFTKLSAGDLSTNNFFSGAVITDTSGLDGNDFIKYDTTSGALYYDTNGNAAGGMQQFATLSGAPVLAFTDIDVT